MPYVPKSAGHTPYVSTTAFRYRLSVVRLPRAAGTLLACLMLSAWLGQASSERPGSPSVTVSGAQCSRVCLQLGHAGKQATMPLVASAPVSPADLGKLSNAPHPRIFLNQATLTTLRARARAGSPEWRALKARCDAFLTGTVEWPDGNAYPDNNSIGAGYQGDGYMPAVLDIGLCYQVALALNASVANQYGAKGADVLEKMSGPAGDPHAVNPLTDDGYGIRFYGVGMAIGYDWLYYALAPAERTRIIVALHRWIDAFKQGGFENDFPQGNYFAGYYDATAMAALATNGDDPNAGWTDWLTDIHDKFVQPYYAANLSGGGWPEGWNYGPFGVMNMSWPALAAKTAAGIDLIHQKGAAFPFPLSTARFLLYFTWPNLLTEEDSDFSYDGDNPTPTHNWLVTFEAGLLSSFRDPFAKYFQSYARAVRSVQPAGEFGPNWDPAIDFLFWNRRAPARDYRKLPRSYVARGIEMAATRSSWGRKAVWAEFKSGPYTAYPENGEELFDQGSLAIVNGSKPFLVNAWSALVRNTPGTTDGSALWNDAYNDVLGDNSPRDLFNVFYVDQPSPSGQGNYLRSDGSRTTIDRFRDAGKFVVMRGMHLEDQYPRNPGQTKTIKAWTREVVYVRPELFVVFDRTEITDPSIDQRMDFHFEGALHGSGNGRFDAGAGSSYAGTVQTILPADAHDSVVDVFNSNKVYRLEVRPPAPASKVHWLTIMDAASAPAKAYHGAPISVTGGTGVLLMAQSRRFVVVEGTAPLQYQVRNGIRTLNVVTGLTPGGSYNVRVSSGTSSTVNIRAGGNGRASTAGVLAFRTP
jgi:hypothetical protein